MTKIENEHRRSTFRLSNKVAVDIEAPAERIWALLTDAQDFPRWNSVVSSIDGTIAEGEKIVLRVPYADRDFKLTVTEARAPHHMVWADGFAPMFRGVRTYRLVEHGDVTRFEMEEVMTGLMLPMIAGSLPDFGPKFEAYARDLKSEAEAGMNR